MYKLTFGSKMGALLTSLKRKVDEGTANVDERKLWKQLEKTLRLLAENPKHPSLASHKIQGLKKAYPYEVWQSYVENHTPGAKRLYWHYMSENAIEVTAVELHPENARDYRNVQ